MLPDISGQCAGTKGQESPGPLAVKNSGGEDLLPERLRASLYLQRVTPQRCLDLGAARVADADIARAIAHVLDWNTNVPAAQVKAVVENGWVTLEGVVEYSFQRDEVERMVRNVRGVLGVTNNIEVRPPVSADDVQALITETLKRQAELDARRIRVEVTDHTAHLYGHVHSVREAAAARAAASRAPGIARVEDHLAVVPER